MDKPTTNAMLEAVDYFEYAATSRSAMISDRVEARQLLLKAIESQCEAMAAWGAAQERESKDAQRGRSAQMRAAGMAALLSEAIGAGALRFYFDDLKERMEMAIADQERAQQGD